MRWLFNPPHLTGVRMTIAMATALIVDTVQLLLGPLGFVTPLDDVMDLVAMAVITWAVGFHPLLLPTFIAEIVPVVDMVPTWTGCTLAVLALRRGKAAAAPPPMPGSSPNAASAPDTDHMKRAKVVGEPPITPSSS